MTGANAKPFISKTFHKTDMSKRKISIFSLTTTYLESKLMKRPSFVHSLNRELVKLGIEIKTITPHVKDALTSETIDGVDIKRFKYVPEKYEINSIAIAEVSKSTGGKSKIILMFCNFFVCAFMECIRSKPDVFHGHWAIPGGFIAFILSKIFRKRFIVSVHGGEITFLKKINFLRKIVVYSLNKSSLVVANSSYTKNRLISIGVKDEKIVIIKVPPNFVSKVQDREFLIQYKNKFTDPSNKIILFVGRLVEPKGAEYLIRSISCTKNKNIHLIIAGDGVLLGHLKELTSSLGLEKKVTFFGWANHEDISKLHGISDIFVVPSVDTLQDNAEGLGLVIPEAMASGLPVIATSVGGIVDIIKHEVNGLLVNQKDPKSIAEAIDRIISDKELEEQIIENSKDTVQEFLPMNIAKKYFDIFQDLFNHSGK